MELSCGSTALGSRVAAFVIFHRQLPLEIWKSKNLEISNPENKEKNIMWSYSNKILSAQHVVKVRIIRETYPDFFQTIFLWTSKVQNYICLSTSVGGPMAAIYPV